MVRRRRALLGNASLFVLASAVAIGSATPSFAQTFGGDGGGPDNPGAGGGFGQNGDDGTVTSILDTDGITVIIVPQGGGGGAGITTGGAGGAGAVYTYDGLAIAWGGDGGAGGAAYYTPTINTSQGLGPGIHNAGGNGGDGGAPISAANGGGGGGGAGGYGVYAATALSFSIGGPGTLSGGRGGNGGSGGFGGDGGDGGLGAYFVSGGRFSARTLVQGGDGGSGGEGLRVGGDGGDGGAGFQGAGTRVVVSGTLQGGDGGVAGTGPTAGRHGAGGAGIVGSDLTIVNTGTIAGGVGGDGVTQAKAISVTGGANSLELGDGWSLDGDLGLSGAGTTLTFGLDEIDAEVSNAITGTGSVIVDVGPNVLTLSGTNDYSGTTTIDSGTLRVATEAALGAAPALIIGAPVSGVTGLAASASALSAAISAYAGSPTSANATALAEAQGAYRAAIAAGRDAGTMPTLEITGATVLDGTSDVKPVIGDGNAAAFHLSGEDAGLTLTNFSGVFMDPAMNVGGNAVVDFSADDDSAGYVFSLNNSTVEATLMLVRSGTVVSFSGAQFLDSSAGVNSGVFNVYAGGTLVVADSVFDGNSTAGHGGAIANFGTLAIQGSTFTGNSAVSGGAIKNGVGGTAVIVDSSFSNNDALGGGAINNDGVLLIVDSDFIGNVATSSGGAISTTSTVKLSVSEGTTSQFTGNTVNGAASSIHLRSTSLDVDTASGGLLDMRDPLSSETSIRISIDKSGDGTWALGGRNVLASSNARPTDFSVFDGRLYLYGEDEVANTTSADPDARVGAGTLQIDGFLSSFTLSTSGVLVAGGANAIETEGTITLEHNAIIRGGSAEASLGGVVPGRREAGGATSLDLTADGGITVEGRVWVDALSAADSFTLNAELGGNDGWLVKRGAGTVTLTAASSFAGGTWIEEGTLALSGAGALASTGAVDLYGSTAVFDITGVSDEVSIGALSGAAGSLVRIGNTDLTVAHDSDAEFAGTFEGGAIFTKQGTGELLLTGDSSSFNGATGVLEGTLRVGDGTSGALGGTMYVGPGGTLTGSGTIGNLAAVLGTLVAGTTSLTFQDDLLFFAGSTSRFALGGAGGSFTVEGTLDLDGALEATVASAGYYALFSYGALEAGSAFSATDVTGSGGFTPVRSLVGYGSGTDSAVTIAVLGAGQQMQFWDGANMTGNGTVEGGTGTWNAGSSNWTGAPGEADINGPWLGSVGVFMGTAGTVTVSGTQSFDTLQFIIDGYVLTGGTLKIAPATGATGVLSADGGVDVTIGSVIADGSAASSLAKLGGGTVILTGTNTYSGGTSILSGTLSVSSDANLGAADGGITFDSGGLRVTGTSYGSSARAITLETGGGDIDIVEAGHSFTVSQAISGEGLLQKEGAGTLILTGVNTYTGFTIISGGTLALSGSGSVAASSAVGLVEAGTVFDISAADGDRTIGGLGGVAGGSVVLGANDLTVNPGSSFSPVFGGTISGTGALIKEGTGTQGLAGINSYTGGTTITAGTLALTGAGTLAGDGAVTLAGAGAAFNIAGADGNRTIGALSGVAGSSVALGANTLTVDAGTTGTFAGTVSGTGGLTKAGYGTLVLTGTNSYAGGTTLASGIIEVSADANLGAASGGLTFDGGMLATSASFTSARAIAVPTLGGLDVADGTTLALSGTVSGAGTLAKIGTGALVLSGTSSVNWNVQAGGLTADAAQFTGDVFVAAGAGLTFSQATAATYDGTLSGAGSLTKTGSASLNYTGDGSSFTGTTTVAGGLFTVNSLLGGPVTVLDGGTIGGAGTVGPLTLLAGATVAPGNSPGQLTINGDIVFEAGSTYEVEVAGNGAGDLIVANSRAIINGGTVEVTALDPRASYQAGQTYRILSTEDGILGGFDAAMSASPFLRVELTEGAADIDITVAVEAPFTSAALAPNQFATAAALDTLAQSGAPLALYNSLLFLSSAGEARHAFDQLSGEVHASAQSVFMEQSSLIRGALVDRLRAAQGGVGASAGTVVNVVETSSGALAYAAPSKVQVAADMSMPMKAAPVVAPVERFSLWTTGFGNWGSFDGNANASGINDSTGGFLIGADTLIGSGWWVGVAGGYSYSDFSSAGRNASGSSDNWHAGLYAGNVWGPLALRTGLSYTWQDVSTSRQVGFTGFFDSLSADYDTGTFQAFGELGWRIDTAFASFEPFANLAYVSLDTSGYFEQGGAAALFSDGSDMDTTFTTLGLRASKEIALGSYEATLRGVVGWRHAFGDITPSITQAFLTSDAFTVTGVPIAEDAAVIEAGLDVRVGEATTLGIAYTGQFGGGVTQNGFNASLSVKF